MSEPECTCCVGPESDWFNGKCERHYPKNVEPQRPFVASTETFTWKGPPANLQNLPRKKS